MIYTCYELIYPNGCFYIGSTTENDLEAYLKEKHKRLIQGHPDLELECYTFENVKKVILSQNFESEQQLRDFEKKEIKKHIRKNPNCLSQETLG